MRFILFMLITIISLLLTTFLCGVALNVMNIRDDIAVGFGLAATAAVVMVEIKLLIWLWSEKY